MKTIQTTTNDTLVYNAEYAYDESDRVIKTVVNNMNRSRIEYEYNGSYFATRYYNEDTLYILVEGILNNLGYLANATEIYLSHPNSIMYKFYTYDAEGYLIKSISYNATTSDTVIYNILGGNRISQTLSTSSGTKYRTDYTYYLDLPNQNTGPGAEVYGHPSNNLKKTVTSQILEPTSSVWDPTIYNYEFDQDGKVIQLIQNYSAYNDTTRYEYWCEE